MNDPHILLNIVCLSGSQSLHSVFLSSRAYAALAKASDERLRASVPRWTEAQTLRWGTLAWWFPHSAWTLDGVPHNLEGPAMRHGTTTEWYAHGVPHRDDGPAFCMYSDNSYMAWWRHGDRHRVGGPAVIDKIQCLEEWWEDGEKLAVKKDGRVVYGKVPPPPPKRPRTALDDWLRGSSNDKRT